MDTKYHINPETQRPNLCKVKTENCKVSNKSSDHYPDKETAKQVVENEDNKRNLEDLIQGDHELGKTMDKAVEQIETIAKDKMNGIDSDSIRRRKKAAEDTVEEVKETAHKAAEDTVENVKDFANKKDRRDIKL